jgi:hypothetical protein
MLWMLRFEKKMMHAHPPTAAKIEIPNSYQVQKFTAEPALKNPKVYGWRSFLSQHTFFSRIRSDGLGDPFGI